jgi:hypothetical protein
MPISGKGAVRLVRETGKPIAQVAARISAVLAWQPGGPWPRLLAVLAATRDPTRRRDLCPAVTRCPDAESPGPRAGPGR